MRKIASAALAALALSLIPAAVKAGPGLKADNESAWENAGVGEAKQAKWFKVLVTDLDSGREKLKITLPFSLVEIFMRAHTGRHMRVNLDDRRLDLKEIFRELKKLGPLAVIEISEDDERIKIWLE
jgi:hypothetical protein